MRRGQPMRLHSLLPLVALLACRDGAVAPVAKPMPSATQTTTAEPVRATARQLTSETPLTMRSGTPLKAPSGWWLTEDGDLLLLEDPTRSLKSWWVETSEPDAERAIAAAWERATPGARWKGEVDVPPPSNGWDAVTTISYEAGDDRVVEAVARRLGALTYVSLVEGSRAAVSRREAQIEQVRASVRPKGLREESFAGATPRTIDATRARELDAFIASALSRLGVPGAAVAVVQGNTVLYERAFGRRELGKKDAVTPNTLFMIGSITKPMTTFMQAALVDAGVFGWQTPVTSLLPTFALGDPELTRKIAMWHMSCACTGMPRNDFEHLFQFDNVTPEARVASMSTMKPTTPLGETYQYSNLTFAAGGFIASHAYAPKSSLGDAYASAMRRKVFEPLGMKSTTLDFPTALRAEHASPHATAIDGSVRSIPVSVERNVIPISPAGGVWSNLRDMERYVMTEMSNGVAPDGKRVVTEKNLLERRILRTGDPVAGGYGLGIDIGRFHGLAMLSHDGGAMGFGTSMFLLPEPKIAILVLTNVRNGAPTEYLPFNAVVKRRVIEALFEGARSTAATELDYHTQGKAKANARSPGSVAMVPDAERVKKLAGTYANANLGTLTLAATRSGATLDAGEWRGAVGQRIGPGGTMTLVFLDPPFPGAEFTIGGDDAKPTLTVSDGQTTYVFTRASSAR